MQFILSEDGTTFQTGALSFNDVPQTNLIANAMVYKAFEEYATLHQISIVEDDSIWTDLEETTEESNTTENDASITDTKTNEITDVSLTEENIGKKTEEQFSMSLVDGKAYYSELVKRIFS